MALHTCQHDDGGKVGGAEYRLNHSGGGVPAPPPAGARKGVNGVEIVIKGEATEIAALVLAVQERQSAEKILTPEEWKHLLQSSHEQLLQNLGNQFDSESRVVS